MGGGVVAEKAGLRVSLFILQEEGTTYMHTGANTQVPASNKTLTNSRWRISIFQISSGWHLCTQRLGYKV